MKNIYKQFHFKCDKKKCGHITTSYLWSSDVSKASLQCVNCGLNLTSEHLYEPEQIDVHGIRTDTKNR